MLSEIVVNARHLSGQGPLWMLYQALQRAHGARARIIVSDRDTAAATIDVLRGLGMSAELDPIGDEFHVLCHAEAGVEARLGRWLRRGAAV